MNRAVVQRRLAEAEQQIANGLRHIARQRDLIAELQGLSYCKLTGSWNN